jgi:hypothetical protein
MSDRPALRHRRNQLDYLIELASGLTAVGMFAYGVALSYQVLHAIAAAAGLPAWAARLWPLASRRSWTNGAARAFDGRLRRSHQPVSTQRLRSLELLGGDRAPAGVEKDGRLVGCRAGSTAMHVGFSSVLVR